MNKSGASTTTSHPERLPARQASGVEGSARAERRDALLRFLADPPPDVAEAARALRAAEERYGHDSERELADLEAGQHPLHLAKADPSTG